MFSILTIKALGICTCLQQGGRCDPLGEAEMIEARKHAAAVGSHLQALRRQLKELEDTPAAENS